MLEAQLANNEDISMGIEEPTSELTHEMTRCQKIGFKLLKMYHSILKGIPSAVFFFNAYCGFGIYTFLSFAIILSPYYSILSGLAMPNILLIIGSILQLFVGYPVFELLQVIPLGIYRQTQVGKEGMKPISPLHWILNFIHKAYEERHEKKLKCGAIFVLFTFIDTVLLITLIEYLINNAKWASFLMLILMMVPLFFGVSHLLFVFCKSWYYTFKVKEDYQSFLDADIDPKEIPDKGWPFVSRWGRYIDDPSTEPFRCLFRKGDDTWSLWIILILYLVLLGINIYFCVTHFTVAYVASTVMNFILMPFNLRFNIFKLLSKDKMDKHPRLKNVSRNVVIANIIIFVTSICMFLFVAFSYPKQQPVFVPKEPFVPFNNTDLARTNYPSFCHSKYHGLSLFSFLLTADAAYQSVYGDEALNNTLSLGLGEDWNTRYSFNTINNTRAKAIHLRHLKTDYHIITIKGDTSFSDACLSFACSFLWKIPQLLYSIIPMAQATIGNFVEILVRVNTLPLSLYDPIKFSDIYIAPIISYVNQINSTNVILIGHSSGGAIAKLVSMRLKQRAAAVVAPEVQMWYIGTTYHPQQRMSHLTNLVIKGELMSGLEAGSYSTYIPIEPSWERKQIPEIACISSLICGQRASLKDYCNQMVGEEKMKTLELSLPFPIDL